MQIQVGIITVSDRASRGQYDDLGGPALKKAAAGYGWQVLAEALVPDEKSEIQRAIREQIRRNMRLPSQQPLPPLSYNGQLPGIATVQPFGTRQHIRPDGQAQRLVGCIG